MKRGAGGMLTGGTGDVNPQWLQWTITQSGADTTTTTAQPIPIQRLPDRGRAQVMEVLKVAITHTAMPVSASAAENIDSISVYISTKSQGTTATSWAEPTVFAAVLDSQSSAFTAAGTYMSSRPTQPFIMDLTDGAGHGYLIATDNVFGQVTSGNTGATNSAIVRLYYRWKNVGLAEYIGIVQSQQ